MEEHWIRPATNTASSENFIFLSLVFLRLSFPFFSPSNQKDQLRLASELQLLYITAGARDVCLLTL